MSNEKRETGRKDDRPMVKVKKGNPAAPLLILRWPLLALANFLLVLAFQALFIHTHPAPLTPDRLEALPYFSNCDVRSIAGAMPTQAGLMRGQSDPNWVLYRNSAGETRAVRIEWNLLLPRYKIEKGTDTLIPDDVEVYTFTKRDFLGKSEVTVSGQSFFSGVGSTGLFRQQGDIMTTYVLWTLGLMLLESAVKYQVEKKRKPRPAAPAGQ